MKTKKESTEDRQKYEHNKTFEERCGIKRETITVVSLLFIILLIHCHFLALRNCVFSTIMIDMNQCAYTKNSTWNNFPKVSTNHFQYL